MTTIMAAVTPTWMISSTSCQSCRKLRTPSITVQFVKPALLAALEGLGDSQKFGRLEAGPADESAVHVASGQQFRGIAGLHGAAIEEPHVFRVARKPAQHLADMG